MRPFFLVFLVPNLRLFLVPNLRLFLVPTLRVGMPVRTLRVLQRARRVTFVSHPGTLCSASMPAFRREAWEREQK